MGRRYVVLTSNGIQEATADALSHACGLASQRAQFIDRPLNVHDRQAGGFIVCIVNADGTTTLTERGQP